MTSSRFFVIENDSPTPLLLNVEPECVLVPLQEGEEVRVHDPFIKQPVTLRVTRSDSGDIVISVWPGDGDVTVTKNGDNVLDLFETDAAISSNPIEPDVANANAKVYE